MDGYCLQQGVGVTFALLSFCKRHDNPVAGGDSQASQILQPVDCERLKRMKAK
jgi:hypothetical protein